MNFNLLQGKANNQRKKFCHLNVDDHFSQILKTINIPYGYKMSWKTLSIAITVAQVLKHYLLQ